MKITEMVTLLKAGYSKAEIDELRASEVEQVVETSRETTEETLVDTSEETTEENITEATTSIDSELMSPILESLTQLQQTVKELQKANLQNARQPEVVDKSPLESASDILFNSVAN